MAEIKTTVKIMMNTHNIKSYDELITFDTFEERFEYLKLSGIVGNETFGYDRYLNQILYGLTEWKRCRDKVIVRDNGCDLGVEGFEIFDKIIIHHINPISITDVINRNPKIFDMDNLICTTLNTHNAIHYGNSDNLYSAPIIRRKNDTCPWKV